MQYITIKKIQQDISKYTHRVHHTLIEELGENAPELINFQTNIGIELPDALYMNKYGEITLIYECVRIVDGVAEQYRNHAGDWSDITDNIALEDILFYKDITEVLGDFPEEYREEVGHSLQTALCGGDETAGELLSRLLTDGDSEWWADFHEYDSNADALLYLNKALRDLYKDLKRWGRHTLVENHQVNKAAITAINTMLTMVQHPYMTVKKYLNLEKNLEIFTFITE